MSDAPPASSTEGPDAAGAHPGDPSAIRSRVRIEGLTALSFAVLGALFGSPEASMGIACALFAVPRVLRAYCAEHEFVRIDALRGATPARIVRRMFLVPAMALLGLLGVFAVMQGLFDVKWSSFVWESLPPETIAGRTYAWPGVYATEVLEHDNRGGRSWYVTGGPYVPLPDDSPEEAAARVVSYLYDRYDVDADPVHVEQVLAAARDTLPPERLQSSAVHPYTAGMTALEDEYSGAVFRALALRTFAVALAILLAASLLIRVGVARPPAWVSANLFVVAFTVPAVALVAASWFTDVGYVIFQAGVPLFRFHAQHVVPVTAAVLALSGFVLASAYRRAKALAVELAR